MFHLLLTMACGAYHLATPLNSSTHLKPGALTTHVGRVYLVKDSLTIRYPYESLLNTTLTIQLWSEKLMSLSRNINDTTYRESKAPSRIRTTNILQLLGDRINFLPERIKQEHKDITLHPVHSRSKRGLLNIVGSASKFLFGTATEDDVQDLKDHYNRVLTVASQNHRMVTLAFKKINILHDNLQKLLEHTNKLTN